MSFNVYFNKNFIEESKIKDNTFYQYIEIENIDKKIDKDSQNTILISDKSNYNRRYNFSWLPNNLSYYDKLLKEGQVMFINCDMYDDFLEFKLAVKKINNKLYLHSVKHILNKNI